MGVMVNDDHRGQTTGPETSDRLERKPPITSNPPDLNIQLTLEVLKDLFGAPYIAGRSHTDPDDMLSSGDGCEKGIEGGNPEDL